MFYWFLFTLCVAAELFGTACLKASRGFTQPWPIAGVAVGYGLAFYLLARVLNHLPVGIVYACWSGLGTVGIALIGVYLFKEMMQPAAWLGIGLVVAGIVVLSFTAPQPH